MGHNITHCRSKLIDWERGKLPRLRETEHRRAMNEEEERAGMLVVSWLGDDGCGAISLEKDVTGSTQHNSLHIQIDRLSGGNFLGLRETEHLHAINGEEERVGMLGVSWPGDDDLTEASP
jgi:hypothetical protein